MNSRQIVVLGCWGLLATSACNSVGSEAVLDAGGLDLGDRATPDLTPRIDLTIANDLALLPGYPADHPPLPQAVSSGGMLLTAPELTAVTFDGDPYRTQLEPFVARVGASSWWSAVSSEYGIAAGRARAPIHVMEQPPMEIDDNEIADWLGQMLDGTHPEFGVPGDGSLFMIFYPESVSVTLAKGVSCRDFHAYHSSTALPDGHRVAYAVMPRCGGTADDITTAASHELIEAATDPYPHDRPAYQSVDPKSVGWSRVFWGGEVGDLCYWELQSRVFPDDLGFSVQRSWSNRAALADHEPCVPADSNHFYFNSAALLPGGSLLLQLPVGVPVTVPLALFSTGPTAPWSLSASVLRGVSSMYSFEFNPPTGKNGDKVMMKVTLLKRGTFTETEGFVIHSELGGTVNSWPVAVRAL